MPIALVHMAHVSVRGVVVVVQEYIHRSIGLWNLFLSGLVC